MKTCIKCGVEFVSSVCLPCKRIRSAEYYKKNKESILAKSAVWREANRDKIRAIGALYRKNNPDLIRESQERHFEKYPEKRHSAQLKYRLNNPDKHAAFVSSWAKRNPEARKLISHNRRAKIISGGGRLSNGLAEKLHTLQKGMCACCGEPLGDNYHLDHIMPLALGGSNEDWNIQLLRQQCNQQKSAKHPVDFMRERGLLL